MKIQTKLILIGSSTFLFYLFPNIAVASTLTQAHSWEQNYSDEDKNALFGHKLLIGDGVKIDLTQGIKLIQEASKKKSSFGQFLLAKELFLGSRVTKDLIQAKELSQMSLNSLIKRAQTGDAFAQYCLGFYYQSGLGGIKDLDQALEWYTKSAIQGEASAQNNLGMMFFKGEGVRQDQVKGFEWFLKSAEQNHAVGQINVGNSYVCGCGTTIDITLARAWYQKSADLGSQFAISKLQELDLSSNRLKVTVLEKPFYSLQGFEPPTETSEVGRFQLTDNCSSGKDANCRSLLKANYEKSVQDRPGLHTKEIIISPRDANGKYDYLSIEVTDPGEWELRIRNRNDVYWQQNGKGPQHLTWKGFIPKDIDIQKNPGALQNTLCILDSPRFCVQDNWYHVELISKSRGDKHLWVGVDNMPPITRNLTQSETKQDDETITHLQFDVVDPIIFWGKDSDAGIASGLPDKLDAENFSIKYSYSKDTPKFNLTEQTENGHKFYRVNMDLKGTWKQNSLELYVADAVGNNSTYLLSGCDHFKGDDCGPFSQPHVDEDGFWIN